MNKYLTFILCVIGVTSLFAGEYIIDEINGLGSEQSLVSVELSGENLVNLGGYAKKIRIYDADGKIVPWYRTQKKIKHFSRQKISHGFKITEVRKLNQADNTSALQVRFELSEKSVLPNEVHLTFHSPMRNFEQQVTIMGIDDNGQETTLLEDGFIYDSSENLDARNLDVIIHPGTYYKFRLLLSAASLEKRQALRSILTQQEANGNKTVYEAVQIADQPFNANHLELWSEQNAEDGTEPCWLEIAAHFNKAGNGNNTSLIQIQPRAYPVSQLHFCCSEPNFGRKIRVYQKTENGTEQTIAQGLIRRLELGGIKDESRIQFPPVSKGTIYVEFQDNDNEPLPLTLVETRLPAYQLQFLAKKSQLPIRITADPDGNEPKYDLETILSLGKSLEMSSIPVTLQKFQGEQIVASQKDQDTKKNLPKGLLYGAVILAVLAMTAALVKIGKSASDSMDSKDA